MKKSMADSMPHFALVMGLVSGLLSGLSIFLPWGAYAWMPGLIYGLVVLLSLNKRYAVLRIIPIGALPVSTFAYFIAFLLQRYAENRPPVLYLLSTGIAGLIGSGLISLIIRAEKSRVSLLATGAVAGIVFGGLILFLPSDDTFWILKMTLGFLIWQSATAVVLAKLVRRKVR